MLRGIFVLINVKSFPKVNMKLSLFKFCKVVMDKLGFV